MTQQSSALTDLTLVGGRSAAQACGGRSALTRASAAGLSVAVLRTLRARVKGRFRTLGRYAAATVRGTEWTTSDLCDGTRIHDTTGRVETVASGAPLSKEITPGLTIEYRCAPSGVPPVSSGYCAYLLGLTVPGERGSPGIPGVPNLLLFTTVLVTRSPYDRADECVRDPAGALSCSTFALSAPGATGYRQGGEVCFADHGRGAYRVTFRIGGIGLGTTLAYDAPAQGQAGACGASFGAFFPGPLASGPAPLTAPIAADAKVVSRYSLPAAGSVIGMVIDLAPTGTAGRQVIKGVLYADAGGAPGALLATTGPLTFKSTDAADAYVLNFAPAVALGPGEYWLGIITGGQSGVAGFEYQADRGSSESNANSFAAGPSNPFGPVSSGDERLILDADYDLG